jgi:hypothetical protein
VAEAGVAHGEVGIEVDGLAILSDGPFHLALVGQGMAQAVTYSQMNSLYFLAIGNEGRPPEGLRTV